MNTSSTNVEHSPAIGADVSPAASRAVSWIRFSVILTAINAVLVYFGSSWNFVFGLTWSYPIEDIFYSAGNALGALLVALALTLPIWWLASRARKQPRLLLLLAGIYLIGAVLAIGVYGDFFSMAGQLVIVALALLGLRRSAGAPHEEAQLPEAGVPQPVPATAVEAPAAAPVAQIEPQPGADALVAAGPTPVTSGDPR